MKKVKKTWNLKRKLEAAFRKVWRYSPARLEALQRVLVDGKHGRCEECLQIYNKKLLEVHHMQQLGSMEDLNIYAERMYCPSTSLKILCDDCHKKETDLQRETKKIVKEFR